MRIADIRTDNEFQLLVFRPNEEQYEDTKADIAEKGIEEPLTLDEDSVLLDGYTRFQIARELGLAEVPTRVRKCSDRTDAMRFILRMATKRRHLNNPQIAELRRRILTFERSQEPEREAAGGRKAGRGRPSTPKGEVTSPHPIRGPQARDRAAEGTTLKGQAIAKWAYAREHEDEFPEVKHRVQQALEGHDSIEAVYKKTRILVKEKEARAADETPSREEPTGGEQKLLGSRESPVDQVVPGDALEILPTIASHSVDLVVTSPPYADNRKATYEGWPTTEYVQKLLPIIDELARVLKPDGSFVLNIKERVVDGERGTYVHDLIREMRKRGWRWVEEYVWVKKNTIPGYWPTRFQDRWEHCHHFTRSDKFRMYQSQVQEDIGAWAEKRLAKLSEADLTRLESATRSGFGRNMSRWVGKDKVNPSNVVILATESSDKGHSAAFPERLPAWFIRLFTREGDTVLDPFMGSGTTAVAAVNLGRHYLGIEMHPPYRNLAKRRADEAQVEFAKRGTPPDYLLPVSKANGQTDNELVGAIIRAWQKKLARDEAGK